MSYGAIGGENRISYEFVLDVYGRCIREIDNMGQVTENEYDSLGNLIYQKDRNGIATRYQYDGLSRNTEKTNDKNGFLQYEYTDFGEVCKVTDGTANQNVKYNSFGETTEIIRDMTSDFFEYDDEGRLISKIIQDKDMGTVQNRYTYDKRGNVTSIETGMGVEYITYDRAGRITKKENSQSGIAKTYSYYPTGLVKDILTWQNDEVVYTESYEYDQNGNKIYEDLNGEIKRYAYDGMGRLKTVTDKDGNITEYEFDDFGNISKEYDISERGIKTKQYYYDSNNRLIMSDSPNETVQYEYDNSGNLLEKTTGYGGRIKKTYYRYDGYNRLSEYISGDVVSEYTYNLDGLRESKTVGGKYTRFMYDGMNIIGELCEGDYYIYHRGTELIGYQSYSGKSYYYRQDSHGNVTALLDFAGNEVKNYKYDAYGEPQGTRLNPAGDQTIIYQWKAETERVYNPFGFCGEYADAESGLIYLRNRYYDPSVGRFVNEDPIRDGLNWYIYCGGNPVMFVDPWGLFGKNTVLSYNQVYNIDVAKAQNELICLGYMKPLSSSEKGYYGNKTIEAVKAFQKDRGLTIDGLIGRNTWTALGLKFDNDYESGGYSGLPSSYNRSTFVLANGPSLESGLSLGSVEVGIAKIGGNYKYASWEVDAVSAEAQAGISRNYVGIDLEGGLVKAEGGFKIPLPFTEKSLFIGGEVNLFAVGVHTYYDKDSGKIKVGVSALVGAGVSLGIVD